MGARGSRYIASAKVPIFVETWDIYTGQRISHPRTNTQEVSYYNEEKKSSRGRIVHLMMYLSGKCDNIREDKHTARRWTAQYHVPRTHLLVASGSPLHHRCAAILPLRRRLRPGEERQPYSVHCQPIHRDDKGPHKACNEMAQRVVEMWVP
jgi:hypothetical protein